MQSSKPPVQFAFSEDKKRSNYAQPVSEESWGPAVPSQLSKPNWQGAFGESFVEGARLLTFLQTDLLACGGIWESHTPSPEGPRATFSMIALFIFQRWKNTPARNSVWPCVSSFCTGGCTSAFLMSNLTTSREFLSPGGIQSIDTVGFLRCSEILTTSSPPPKLLTCHLGAKLIYTNQNLSNDMFFQRGYFWFTPL